MDDAISKVSLELVDWQAGQLPEHAALDQSASLRESPGPGSYCPFTEFGQKSLLSTKATPRNFSFARSPNLRIRLNPHNSPPSTLYSPKYSLTETRALAPKIQKGANSRLNHLTELSKRSPGPVYDLPTLGFKSATFSKALRTRSSEPTSQTPHFYPTDRCFAYLRNKPGVAFSSLKRRGLFESKEVNGAPFYTPVSQFRRTPVPRLCLTGRSTTLQKQESPPVGLYSPTLPKRERSFVIPKAAKGLRFSPQLYQGKEQQH